MASATLIAPAEETLLAGNADRRSEYRCECGHVLRVFGGGRHRVYFEPGNTRLDDPRDEPSVPRVRTRPAGKEPTVITRRATNEPERFQGKVGL